MAHEHVIHRPASAERRCAFFWIVIAMPTNRVMTMAPMK